MNKKLHVRTGDVVVVLSGKDKGKKGSVLKVIPKKDKVIVEGVNIVTKHKKPRKMGEEGGLVKQEAAIYACKVMNVCQKCKQPTRIARKVSLDGKIKRYCKKCNEEF